MSSRAAQAVGSAFRAIGAALRKPWVIGLLVVLVLSLLVWFLLPAVSLFEAEPFASAAVRAAIIAVLVCLWAIYVLVAYLNSGEIAAEPPPPSEDALARQRHLAVVEERRGALVTRFERQMQVLAEHLPGRRSGQYAYHLPWFLVMGPEGAGKTTLLTRCEQDFPLSHLLETDPLAPILPTEDLPAWVTNDAVYIDTPGDLFGTASGDEDRLWSAVTGLLNRFRGRRPVNGVILVLSLETLIAQSDHERATEARAIRQRLLGLMDRLGTRFPIYVVLSKADMLAGFVEFFDDLRKYERGQIWGMSFELPRGRGQDGGAWQDAFRRHSTAMTERLNARLLKRLSDERDPARRLLIQGFPQRFGGIQGIIGDTLAQIFVVDRYTTPPLLRGVYFTSAVQVGVPYDPLMGAVSLSFDVERPPLAAHRSAHPFFTKQLFEEVFVPEAGLAADNRRVEMRKAWAHRLAYAGAATVVAGCGYAWWTSYQTNVGMLQDTMARLDVYGSFAASAEPALAAAVPALDALRTVRDRFVMDDRNPLLARIALSSSHEIAPLSQDAYDTALRTDFAPRLAAQMATVLRARMAAGDGPALMDALRVYLMLTQPQHRQPRVVAAYLDGAWKADATYQPLRPSLTPHLQDWLAMEPPPAAAAPDMHLVSQARQILSRVPRAERVYSTLKSEGLARLVGGIDIDRNAGPLFHTVFRQRPGGAAETAVPRLFTVEGWETHFNPRATDLSQAALEDGWVVGDIGQGTLDDREFRAFQLAIGEHYMRDYVAEWRTLLDSLEVVRIDTLPEAVQVLEAMSGPASPVRSVLDLVSRNTHLPLPVTEADVAAEGDDPTAALDGAKVPGKAKKAAKAAQAAGKVLAMLPGEEGEAPPPPPGHLDATATVEAFFAPVNDTLKGEAGATYYDTVATGLHDLYTFTREISESVDPAAAAMEIARARAAGHADDPITRLRLIAGSAPAPLQGWLNSVATQTWGAIMSTAEEHLNDQWAVQVYAPWQDRLAGRYPIDRTSDRDVSLSDLGNFLAPTGVLETYFAANLAPFVDTRTWQLRVIDGAAMDIDPQVLRQFRHARELRKALFTADGQVPQVTFNLRPQQLDPTVARSILVVDGQTVEYRHGPTQMTQMQWPNPNGASRSEMRFQEVGPYGRILRVAADGAWAWFRLLDKAKIETVDGHMRVTFTVSERNASYDLWVDRQDNPFLLPNLPPLDLPPRL